MSESLPPLNGPIGGSLPLSNDTRLPPSFDQERNDGRVCQGALARFVPPWRARAGGPGCPEWRIQEGETKSRERASSVHDRSSGHRASELYETAPAHRRGATTRDAILVGAVVLAKLEQGVLEEPVLRGWLNGALTRAGAVCARRSRRARAPRARTLESRFTEESPPALLSGGGSERRRRSQIRLRSLLGSLLTGRRRHPCRLAAAQYGGRGRRQAARVGLWGILSRIANPIGAVNRAHFQRLRSRLFRSRHQLRYCVHHGCRQPTVPRVCASRGRHR